MKTTVTTKSLFSRKEPETCLKSINFENCCTEQHDQQKIRRTFQSADDIHHQDFGMVDEGKKKKLTVVQSKRYAEKKNSSDFEKDKLAFIRRIRSFTPSKTHYSEESEFEKGVSNLSTGSSTLQKGINYQGLLYDNFKKDSSELFVSQSIKSKLELRVEKLKSIQEVRSEEEVSHQTEMYRNQLESVKHCKQKYQLFFPYEKIN